MHIIIGNENFIVTIKTVTINPTTYHWTYSNGSILISQRWILISFMTHHDSAGLLKLSSYDQPQIYN